MLSVTDSADRKSSKRSWFRSLYSRIALTFLLLLLAMRGAQALLFFMSWQDVALASDQLLDWDMAGELAPKLEPILADTIDHGELDRMLFLLSEFRPHVTAYILDSKGHVRGYFGISSDVVTDQVDTAQIERFLRGPDQALPVLISDPQQPKNRVPFSAARLQVAKASGYLLITLRSRGREVSSAVLLRSEAIRTASLGIALALLATGLVGLFVFSWLTRPLRSLTESVRNFQQGNLGSRFSGGSDDEIGELGHSFNSMADTIAKNISLLEHTDKQRRQLIANVSHDLRGPLTSITGFLSTLEQSKGQLTEEMITRCHEIIHRNAQLLNRMIEELFDLAKLEAKESPLERSSILADDMLRATFDRYQLLAEQSGISLHIELNDGELRLDADPFLLERVFANLTENALRYTPRGGHVYLTATLMDETKVRLSIRDTGKGIAEDEISQIFARFYQADLARKSAGSGAGLGLAIAQRIVEAHGSRIEILSTVGVGTTFYFDLPTAYKKTPSPQ